jgi:hypothetical protein
MSEDQNRNTQKRAVAIPMKILSQRCLTMNLSKRCLTLCLVMGLTMNLVINLSKRCLTVCLMNLVINLSKRWVIRVISKIMKSVKD